MDIIPLRFSDGRIANAIALDGSASWNCPCGHNLPLLARTVYLWALTECPNCHRRYVLNTPEHGGKALEVVEVDRDYRGFKTANADEEVRPEGISSDQWRLVRMFRSMNTEERSSTLMHAGEKLMERLSVYPYLRKYDMTDPSFADEMSPENVGDFSARLICAAPMPDGSVLCWDNLGDPGQFQQDTLDDASSIVFGVSDDDSEVAKYLARCYLDWLSDYNSSQHPSSFFTEEEIDDVLPQDFLYFIREWRELVLKTLEKQKDSGTGE